MRSPVTAAIGAALKPAPLRFPAVGVCSGFLNRCLLALLKRNSSPLRRGTHAVHENLALAKHDRGASEARRSVAAAKQD
jgi:hypothetical protein